MSDDFKQHPIQLKALQVLKLNIEVHDPAKALSDNYSLVEYSLETGRSDFDESDNTIQVMMRIRAGKLAVDSKAPAEKNELFASEPVSFLVEVGGVFEVDLETFPRRQIHRFAERNAPLIIYPYVREQVYGLSTRVGIKHMLLPLFEVPAFTIAQTPKSD
ncbi:protein-export chaperone SecB [Klebsiella pneumoniae]|uniref:protein-export chaperone SecB n=1 Tax=Klebsiella pneumoniae TaxID=573 RepID=UPI000E3DBE07|nr:protein-export chaperone SecB [Klebsiella pneumoniae]HBR3248693.1 protein-export chaperone SecB [Klebsiella pneumoniae]